MSVLDSTTVDFVALAKSGDVLLTISDHLDWNAENEHLRLLQEKINTYCKYVETGQIYDEYPDTRDRRPLISIVLFNEPTVSAKAVLVHIKEILDVEGFGFEWKMYSDKK
jgi:hypothetical protein